MFKQFIFVSALLISTVTSPTYAEDQTGVLKKIKDSKVITLGHRESSVPFSYYGENQQVTGYSHELMLRIVDAIKSNLNQPDLKIQLMPITSQNRISLVQNGTIDIECGSTTNNSERQKQVNFSNSIFVISTRLLTNKKSGISDFQDLANKNVVTTAGTTSERILRKMNEDKKLEMKIISAKDHAEAFLALETNRAIAFMMDDALLFGEKAKAKHPDDWVVTGTPQSYEAYGCMMRKDDTQFKKLVDDTLSKLMLSGEATVLYKKWFESPIPPKGINLNFPLSEAMTKLFQNPNDKAFE